MRARTGNTRTAPHCYCLHSSILSELHSALQETKHEPGLLHAVPADVSLSAGVGSEDEDRWSDSTANCGSG